MGGGPAGARLRSWGQQSLDGWHAAQDLGGLGPAEFGGWHAALEQGTRGFDACAGHF